jgi:integrase
MARRIRDADLETRAARRHLKGRGKPYYRSIEEGLHLGYRKAKGRRGKSAGAGKWVARHYVGAQSYVLETIAIADDLSDADGVAILYYWQAQQKAREHMVRRVHVANGISTGPLTVRAAVEAYLEFLESNRKTSTDARYRANAFICPTLGNIEVATLTADVLRQWLVAMAKAPARLRTKPGAKQRHREPTDDGEALRRRRSSANRVWTVLRGALNHAFAEDKVPSDAAWRKVRPFRGVDAARVRYLTVPEAARLISAADAEFRPLVRAALATGARYGELAALRASDFNPDSGTVHVRTSKSGQGRYIVLNDEGAVLFTGLAAGRDGDELLLRRANGEPWGKSHQARPMAEACERANIKPPISFHGLRHTYASLSVMGDVPLMVIAENLGHADTRMVQRHYGHMSRSYVADAIRAGAPRFGFKPQERPARLQI